jgi:hypothetical protein
VLNKRLTCQDRRMEGPLLAALGKQLGAIRETYDILLGLAKGEIGIFISRSISR